ncbi:Uncharacterised protein [Candidatus Anstonella stagnisolia]|nr:Uncharacterised protein [Candidatus Anstonella stagnisolia]
MAKPICKVCKKSIKSKQDLVYWSYISCYHRKCFEKIYYVKKWVWNRAPAMGVLGLRALDSRVWYGRAVIAIYVFILLALAIGIIAAGAAPLLLGNAPALCFSGITLVPLAYLLFGQVLLEKINREYEM